jgi:hypothetical protein
MSADSIVYLNDVWSFYFHGSEDSNWTLASYVRLTDLSSVQDFWMLHEVIEKSLPDNMFFLMREGIDPCWDDPSNLHGGCISLKVPKADVVRTWEFFCSQILGEVLKPSQQVTGISLSPKRFFSILKIWLKSTGEETHKQIKMPDWYKGEVLVRSHLDCIRANSEKLAPPSPLATLAACHCRPSSEAPGTA